MSAEVHRLTDLAPAQEPDKEIIERIEELLESAKRGEVIGFGYLIVRPNHHIGTGWKGGSSTMHEMLAGATALQARITQSWLED